MRGVDDSGLEQRQEAQLHRGRIAARVADDARALDRGAVHLGQAVHRFREEIGARVRHPVPLREHRRILEPEVGREIDDPHAGAHELARLRHRDAVRRREEHDIALVELRFGGLDERERVLAAQAREHVGDLRPGVLARRDRADVDLRVLREQPQQLDAGVAGSADDADLDHGCPRAWLRCSQSILASGLRGAPAPAIAAPATRSGRRKTTKAATTAAFSCQSAV